MDISGKWQKLTDHLKDMNKATIILSDEEIQEIVGSSDNRRPYPIDFPTNPQYSIRQRAEDAGYNVKCHELNEQVKIFERKL